MPNTPPEHRISLEDELMELDQQLFDIIKHRSTLLDKIRKRSKIIGKTSWVESEKPLRKNWEKIARKAGLDATSARTIFSILQELKGAPGPKADSGAERDGERAFLLHPKRGAMDVDMEAPASLRHAQMLAALAVQTDAQAHIYGAIVNDSLVELVKGLNQAGAHLFWDEHGLHSRGGTLTFPDRLVFTGDAPFNFYLMLFLAVAHPGAVKFAGGAPMKRLDLSALSTFMPRLGARLVSLSPGAPGLPARVEASAIMEDRAKIPADLPPEALSALLIAAPSFSRELTLRLPELPEDAPLMAVVAPTLAILESVGISAVRDGDLLTITPGVPQLGEMPALPMDPFLSGALLALPLFARKDGPSAAFRPSGGRVRLTGFWPEDMPEWDGVWRLLTKAGLKLTRKRNAVISSWKPGAAGKVDIPVLDTSDLPDYYPLALALGMGLSASGNKDLTVSPVHETEISAIADSLLEIGGYALKGETLIPPAEELKDAPPLWESPGPEWTVAFALLAYLRPGLKLANPGSIMAVSPHFWMVFNSLPKPEAGLSLRSKPKKEAPKQDVKQRPKRRRVE